MSPEKRLKFASLAVIRGDTEESDPKIREVVAEIKRTGFCKIPKFADQKTVERAKEYFGTRPYYNAQVFAQSNGQPIQKDWRAEQSGPSDRYICFRKSDSVEFLLSDSTLDIGRLKKIADAYCGFNTVMYGVNTMGTYPGDGMGYAMRLHRDYDDFSCLTFFISWTQTSGDNGATFYVPNSHMTSSPAEGVMLDTEAGDLVAVDTFGLHAGNPRVYNPRLTTWIRFGQKINLATIQDGE